MRAFVCVLLSSLALAMPASAAELAVRFVGHWRLGSYSNDQTGQFNHCAASASYVSGDLLLFSVDNKYAWSFGFYNPSWGIITQRTYPISVVVDGSAPINLTAVGLNGNVVEVPMGGNIPLLKRMIAGHVLQVFGSSGILTFNLTSTAAVIPSLLQCVRHYVAPPATAANPFEAPAGRNPFEGGAAANPFQSPAPQAAPVKLPSAPDRQGI